MMSWMGQDIAPNSAPWTARALHCRFELARHRLKLHRLSLGASAPPSQIGTTLTPLCMGGTTVHGRHGQQRTGVVAWSVKRWRFRRRGGGVVRGDEQCGGTREKSERNGGEWRRETDERTLLVSVLHQENRYNIVGTLSGRATFEYLNFSSPITKINFRSTLLKMFLVSLITLSISRCLTHASLFPASFVTPFLYIGSSK